MVKVLDAMIAPLHPPAPRRARAGRARAERPIYLHRHSRESGNPAISGPSPARGRERSLLNLDAPRLAARLVEDIPAERSQQSLELLGDTLERCDIGAADDQAHPELARAVERVAADLDLGMALLEGAEPLGDATFGEVGGDAARMHRRPADEAALEAAEHALHDRGDPRHDEDIADLEARRGAHRIVDENAARRDIGHAQPRLVEIARALVLSRQPRHGLGMALEGDPEGLGDALGGDVVMGWSDATRGEDIVVLAAQRVHRLDDARLD